VNDKVVTGWDDPRMPTISASAARRAASALRSFAIGVGVTSSSASRTWPCSTTHREDLNKRALRRLAVLVRS